MSAEDCTNYVSCAPVPTPFVPTLPPDAPAQQAVLAATGFDGITFLLMVVAAVVVILGVLLFVAGRRSQ